MKKIFLFLILTVSALASWAYDFSAVAPSGQTLYYDISGSTVSVTYPGTHSINSWSGYARPTGPLTIPSTVTYSGTTYSVTSIGNDAFLDCSGLTSVTIPNSVTSIGYNAFYGCSGLTTVTIPNSVTSISSSTFRYCSGLTTITIPNSVTTIGSNAFYGCSGLTTVTIPNSVTTIGDGAFTGCSGLTTVTIPNTVTSISNSAFRYCSGLTTVTIPNSVTTIGNSAFFGCSGLTSVTIGNSVTFIDYDAFYGCSGLTTVNYLGSLEGWCNITFSNYESSPNYYSNPVCYARNLSIGGTPLTHAAIPSSVTQIKPFTFYNDTTLTTVTIPNSVTSIGISAFYGCSGLTTVTIPNSVTTIGKSAFARVRNIIYYGTASGSPWGALCVNGYEEYPLVFSDNSKTHLLGCNTSATTVTIPNSVTSIGKSAFYDCRGLTTVTIPNSVTSIGNYAFYGCSGLTSVTIGDSVTSIGKAAFYDCRGLTTVTIPNSVTFIDTAAFYNCRGLTTVTIGNSVTSICDRAFYGCDSILDITALPTISPTLGTNVFTCSRSTIVNIPCGSLMYYSVDWDYFTNFVGGDAFSVSVESDAASQGSVAVLSQPTCEDPQAVVSATPAPGYHFLRWSDGSTSNPYTLIVDSDTSLIAYFALDGTEGINNVQPSDYSISTLGNQVVITGTTNQSVRIFDSMGRLLSTFHTSNSTTAFPVPSTGVYLVQVANQPAQKVVLR